MRCGSLCLYVSLSLASAQRGGSVCPPHPSSSSSSPSSPICFILLLLLLFLHFSSHSLTPSLPPIRKLSRKLAESAGRQANLGPAGATNSFSKFWETVRYKARNAVTDEPPENEVLLDLPEEQGYGETCKELAELSYQQRLMGFFMVMGMGLVFMVFAFLMAPMVAVVPRKFAFFLTIGNVFCLSSTVFLVGCRYQLQYMFQANRFEAACLYAGSVLMTLLCALWLKTSIGCILFALVQVACLLWYALSFIPFARQTVGMVWSTVSYALRPVISAISSCISKIC